MRAESAEQPLEPCPHCGADHDEACLRCPQTDMVLPFAGRLLAGKFRFVAELGRGGMGAVWRARNIHVDREVAIKLILPEVPKNPEMVARFQNEARVAARIGHAGICDILDFEQTALGPVIVMELLRGENLAQRITRERPLPVLVAVQLIRQALGALEAAHRAGIIHRDLKPENIFLHQSDAGPVVVKLMDFGISKFLDRVGAVTGNGVIMGTPEYMAPEQVGGAANADARTDIWAIGAVLYKAVTGVEPFAGDSVVTVLLAIMAEEPAPIESHVPTVPPGLSAVIKRCLTRAPDERYQSARELSEALKPFETAARPSAAHRDDAGALIVGALISTGMQPTLPALAPALVTVTAPARATALELQAILPPAREPSRWPRWLAALGLLGACSYGAWWFMTQPTATTEAALATRAGGDADPQVTAAPRDAVAPVGPGDLATPPEVGTIVDPNAGQGTSVTAGADPTSGAAPDPVTASVEPRTPGPVEATGEVAGDASAGSTAEPPAPEPPRLIVAGGYVTPSVAGAPGNQHWAKEYCAALDQNKFLGIDRWKLANPREARLFTKVAGIKAAGYWTSANHRGQGLVVYLPKGTDRSMAASKKSARPLCVASKA